MIPRSFVQELLNRVDIVDVIDPYVRLKRAGANLAACCPFHTEKTPSFTVSPSKQFYHCFGCGAHGSAISFLMEYSGLNFVEAVKELAERVGMQVPESVHPVGTPESSPAATQGLGEVLRQAMVFYKSQLKRSERAIAYLKGRGLTGEIAARFGLGYAPPGWQALSAEFHDYASQRLVDAGLVIHTEDGKRYDRFRDRIMFPIVSQRGQVIGFGGRVLDHSEPKYLNSPETALFEKGHELYGLFQARQAIREAGRVLVVEGYMDVVALAQFGIGNAVATLGTATTATHVQKLLRLTDEVVFCFDGDAAGRKAAWRALENALEQLQDGKQVKFLFLPAEHDPDSFLRAEGRDAFDALAARATPLSTFALKELSSRVDMHTAEGRAKFLQDTKALVKRVGAPILRIMLRDQIAQISGLSKEELSGELGIAAGAQPRPAALRGRPAPGRPSLMRNLAQLLAARPELSQLADIALLGGTDELSSLVGTPEERAFLLELLQILGDGSQPVSLGEAFRGTRFEALARTLERNGIAAEGGELEGARQEFLDGWQKMVEAVREAERRQLEPRISSGEASAEERERYRKLQGASPARLSP